MFSLKSVIFKSQSAKQLISEALYFQFFSYAANTEGWKYDSNYDLCLLGDIFSFIAMTYCSPGLAVYVKVYTEFFMSRHLITLQATS